MAKLHNGITSVKKFKATDGQEFDSYDACRRHQTSIERQPAVKALAEKILDNAKHRLENGVLGLDLDGMVSALLENREAVLKALK